MIISTAEGFDVVFIEDTVLMNYAPGKGTGIFLDDNAPETRRMKELMQELEKMLIDCHEELKEWPYEPWND